MKTSLTQISRAPVGAVHAAFEGNPDTIEKKRKGKPMPAKRPRTLRKHPWNLLADLSSMGDKACMRPHAHTHKHEAQENLGRGFCNLQLFRDFC
eukprot:989856-Pelagomonas_calceolata.AAC.1